MKADNMPIEGLTLGQLKVQLEYAKAYVRMWQRKIGIVLQPDSKETCRNEIAYWQQRVRDINHAMFSHPERQSLPK